MDAFLTKHALFWKDRTIQYHLFLSLTLLIASLYLFHFAYQYTAMYTGNVVPDILLDNLPVVDVGYVFFQGAFAFVLFFTLICLLDPKYLPFSLGASAAFFFIRSCFVSMTHLSAPSVEYYKYTQHEHHVANVLFTVSSGNDLFFSAHTGFPFLMALIFWKNRPLRYFALVCSVVGAIAVLLGHLHYSIDVFSAFFITYGIFEISKHFFRKEYSLITNKS